MSGNIHYQVGKLRKDIPEMSPGDTIKVFEKVPGEGKKKSQTFEGILISQKHGRGINATFTLRAIIGNVGVEKTFPLHSPLIEKIKVIKEGKARRAKLYYLRAKAQRAIRKKLKSKRVIEDKVEVKGKKQVKEVKEEKKKEAEKKAELKKEPSKTSQKKDK